MYLSLYCTKYYYWVAGSGELDAREVNTVGTLEYFLDFLKLNIIDLARPNQRCIGLGYGVITQRIGLVAAGEDSGSPRPAYYSSQALNIPCITVNLFFVCFFFSLIFGNV